MRQFYIRNYCNLWYGHLQKSGSERSKLFLGKPWKLFGKALEIIVRNRDERLPRFQKLLNPLRTTLKKQDFVAGESPGFSDNIVFGAFQWARCISEFSLLNADDSVYYWREKMLNLHDGLAKNAVGYAV